MLASRSRARPPTRCRTHPVVVSTVSSPPSPAAVSMFGSTCASGRSEGTARSIRLRGVTIVTRLMAMADPGARRTAALGAPFITSSAAPGPPGPRAGGPAIGLSVTPAPKRSREYRSGLT